jgi:hypothetical protein
VMYLILRTVAIRTGHDNPRNLGNYRGYHAWYGVQVAIEKYVIRGGTEIVTETLQSASASRCCEAPSGGFEYTGTTQFDVQPGDIYGFRMTGKNADSDARLNARSRWTWSITRSSRSRPR